MKLLMTLLLAIFSLSTTPVFAQKMDNITLVTEFYHVIFEEKNFDLLPQYVSKDIILNRDFHEENYEAFQQHLAPLKESTQCVTLKMLPFSEVFASKNKVTAWYTQSCTDSLGQIHNKRIIAIMEINRDRKISKIWAVTHEENK